MLSYIIVGVKEEWIEDMVVLKRIDSTEEPMKILSDWLNSDHGKSVSRGHKNVRIYEHKHSFSRSM